MTAAACRYAFRDGIVGERTWAFERAPVVRWTPAIALHVDGVISEGKRLRVFFIGRWRGDESQAGEGRFQGCAAYAESIIATGGGDSGAGGAVIIEIVGWRERIIIVVIEITTQRRAVVRREIRMRAFEPIVDDADRHAAAAISCPHFSNVYINPGRAPR